MPELPEVETVVRDLRPLLTGRRVVAVTAGDKSLRRAWSPDWQDQLVGATFAGVRRRAKWILLDFAGGPRLLVHLGMTGRLTAVPASAAVEPHTHLTFGLDDGRQLRFRDPRRFGSVELFPDEESLQSFLDERLGPEPFDLRRRPFHESLCATRRPLKAALLDQKIAAGVGNIYADESLFAARLSPGQLACETTAEQAERLRRAIVAVLRKAIRYRGSSIRDYVGGAGQRGGFQTEFQVYGRAGEPCPACGGPIAQARLAGRSTHYCASCQPKG